MATFTDNPTVPGAYLFKGSLEPDQMADKVWVIMPPDRLDNPTGPEVSVFIVSDKALRAPTFSPKPDLLVTPFIWRNGQYEVAM